MVVRAESMRRTTEHLCCFTVMTVAKFPDFLEPSFQICNRKLICLTFEERHSDSGMDRGGFLILYFKSNPNELR